MTSIKELFSQFSNLLRWWVTIAPWEQAIRVRGGKKTIVLGPGIHLRIPFLDRIFRQSVRRRFSSCPVQTLTTADGKALTICGTLGYSIDDVGLLYNTLQHAEAAIESEAQGLVSAYVIKHKLEECSPQKVQEHVETLLNLKKYGLKDVSFIITTFVSVRTYRLLQGEPRDWISGDSLNTNREDQEKDY